MKRAMLISVATVLTLSAMAAAQMGSSNQIVTQVPFQFMVGNTSMPAGTYTVKPALKGTSMLAIQNDKTKAYVAFVVTDERTRTGEGAALLFHKYGDRYFLNGVRANDNSLGQLSEGKLEGELRARNAGAAEKITIAGLN